jgi:hypothetical protein
MDLNDPQTVRKAAAVSDQTLRSIVEDGFFGGSGTLADARSACAEMICARAVIEPQTTKIAQLGSE